MKPGQQVAIWLHDAAAKLFLGLGEKHPVGQWVAVGEVMDIPSPIGVWINISYVEERRPVDEGKTKLVRYGVKPGQCLIRWDYVITAQNLKAPPIPDDPRPVPGLYL